MAAAPVTPWILDPAAAAESPHAGGKARALARAERAGLPVPPWFVVSSQAFDDSLTPDQRRALDEARDAASLARHGRRRADRAGDHRGDRGSGAPSRAQRGTGRRPIVGE
jgi:hypothetical protein